MGALADNAVLTDARSKALTQRLMDHEGELLAKLATIRAQQDDINKQLDAFESALLKPMVGTSTSATIVTNDGTPPAATLPTAPV